MAKTGAEPTIRFKDSTISLISLIFTLIIYKIMRPKFCKKCTSCSIWGDKFWNNFFHPRQKGIFVVLLITLLVLGFTLCFILLALYYEAVSKAHADAYLIMFFSNVVHLITGILILHFLTVPPNQLTCFRCGLIYTGITVSFVLSITAVVQWYQAPTNAQMEEYVTNFFHATNRVPRIYSRLQQDSVYPRIGQSYLLQLPIFIWSPECSHCSLLLDYAGLLWSQWL